MNIHAGLAIVWSCVLAFDLTVFALTTYRVVSVGHGLRGSILGIILRDGERCYVYSRRSELNMSSTGTIYFRHVRTEVLALGIDMLIHSYSILSILNLSHLLLTSLNVSLLGCDLRHNKLTLVFSTLDRRRQKRYQLYRRIQRAVSAHKSRHMFLLTRARFKDNISSHIALPVEPPSCESAVNRYDFLSGIRG